MQKSVLFLIVMVLLSCVVNCPCLAEIDTIDGEQDPLTEDFAETNVDVEMLDPEPEIANDNKNNSAIYMKQKKKLYKQDLKHVKLEKKLEYTQKRLEAKKSKLENLTSD